MRSVKYERDLPAPVAGGCRMLVRNLLQPFGDTKIDRFEFIELNTKVSTKLLELVHVVLILGFHFVRFIRKFALENEIAETTSVRR